MKYLVDTDWIIDHLHGIEKVARKIQDLAPEGLALSIVTLGELYEGVYNSTDPGGNERALNHLIGGFVVLGINEDICKVFGKERGRVRKLGKQEYIGDLDIFIASTCLNYDLILLTNNTKHFEYFNNLKIFRI